jgi:deoxyribodipyrimidine photo-lyase
MIIFIFHRDLRLQDNLGFNEAVKLAKKTGDKILPVFIFTPEQVTDKNKYKSDAAIKFMLESLEDLDEELRAAANSQLFYFFGEPAAVIEKLLTATNTATNAVTAITENLDYTPYAKKRSETIKQLCEENHLEYIGVHDIYLNEPGTVLNKAGKMFQKFTPFYEKAVSKSISHPMSVTAPTLKSILVGSTLASGKAVSKLAAATTLDEQRSKLLPTAIEKKELAAKGGRQEAIKILKALPVVLNNYDISKDTPSMETSFLSAHNHFGTVSIREVYWTAKKAARRDSPAFIRQLIWRDFYGHIVDAFEDLYHISPYKFMEKTEKGWKDDRVIFNKWTRGETGHELVDAGMKQLLATGYIHNRARMVCASYLAKDLKINWRWGERWFAQNLVDYDFSQNFGNWIWVASVLPFASAPFRRLDPEIQLKKFDPSGEYVNKWL